MTNLIGQSLGRYHILEQLGEGGMATVYKAYDTRLERNVAIKLIRAGAFSETMLDNVLKRFEREAKALAKFSHPHIVKVLDYGDYESSPYLVMEYLPGGTLKQLIGKPMPWKDAVRLILPIAQALEYAHAHNIIHRDIKPANILLTDNRQPMLTDFGIAKVLESSGTLTGTGVGIGTPDYMAPEQWTGTASQLSDLYSLAIVLYELIAGRKPYMADTPVAVMLKQVNEPLPRPTNFVADIPEEVENTLIKALEKNPENRYPNLESFRAKLESLLSAPKEKPLPAQPQPAAPIMPGAAPKIEPITPASSAAREPLVATERIPIPKAPPAPEPKPILSAPRSDAPPPYIATQRMEPMHHDALATQQMPPMRVPSQAQKRSPMLIFGVIGAVIVLFLCFAVIAGIFLQVQASQHTQETAVATQATGTKAAAETESAVQATATKLAQNQTATMVALQAEQATAAAFEQIAAATAEWREQFMGGLNADLTIVLGPEDGSLPHNAEDNLISEYEAGVDLKNFVVQATFVNPYGVSVGAWDYGFLFRNESGNYQYRLVIQSSKDWMLMNNTGSADGEVIADGVIDNLSTINGGQNVVRLVCIDSQGILYVNEVLIAELDLSDRLNSGGISIATAFFSGAEITGYFTRYVDFTIWSAQ